MLTRAQRKAELLVTKYFDCRCERCTMPLEESTDRLLIGFVCQRKGCKGVLGETPLEKEQPTVGKEDKRKQAGRGRGKGKAQGGEGGQPEKRSKTADSLWCEECGQGERKKGLTRWEGLLTDAQRNIRTATDVDKKTEELEKLLKDGPFHPLHHLVFNARISLVNVYDRKDDHVNSIRYAPMVGYH